MSTRTSIIAAAVVAVLSLVSVTVVVADRDPPAAVQHGDFSKRFQPVPPGASKDQEQMASIGSIRNLQPVELGGK